MGVPRGTTPTLVLTFDDKDLDLREASHVYVTFNVGGAPMTKSDNDLEVDERQINVYLTQSDTLAFPNGKIKMQANWVYPDGSRGASDVTSVEFTQQLLGSVLP